MPLYTYNITKAKQYLNMWLYAQTGTNHTRGPVGDANFDGIVDLDDLWYWLMEYGNAPYTRPIDWLDPDWYSTYPWPKSGGTIAPGNDIDPDFDNNGIVGVEDFGLWLANFGKEYHTQEHGNNARACTLEEGEEKFWKKCNNCGNALNFPPKM